MLSSNEYLLLPSALRESTSSWCARFLPHPLLDVTEGFCHDWSSIGYAFGSLLQLVGDRYTVVQKRCLLIASEIDQTTSVGTQIDRGCVDGFCGDAIAVRVPKSSSLCLGTVLEPPFELEMENFSCWRDTGELKVKQTQLTEHCLHQTAQAKDPLALMKLSGGNDHTGTTPATLSGRSSLGESAVYGAAIGRALMEGCRDGRVL